MIINPYVFYNPSLINILKYNNSLANLQFCLDAGDINSVSANNTNVWIDLSPANQNFFRGNTVSSEVNDPIYVGTIGNLGGGEYWSMGVGGNTFFSINAAASNTAWWQNLHKNNAQFSGCAWIYLTRVATLDQIIFGTRPSPTFPNRCGISWHVAAANSMQFAISNGAGSQIKSASADLVPNQWTFVAVTSDESMGSGGLMFRTNDQVDYGDATYSGNPTANTPNTIKICASAFSANAFSSNSRISMIAIWDRKLTDSEVSSIFRATRARYGV